jgi:hypothetical protein
MANVKLKVNMILSGTFIPFNSLVDLDRIPPRLQKRKFILRPGEIDYEAKDLAAQEEAVKTEVDIEEPDASEEEVVKGRLANRRSIIRNRRT